MEFTRQLRKHGNGLTLHIPLDIAEDFDLQANEYVKIKPDKGKHGRFISFWKKGE